jgi:hypothetical protein
VLIGTKLIQVIDMNERIKDLAKLAQERAEWMTPQGLEWFDNFKEQFTLLIVKKCMDIAKYHTPDTEECEYTWLIHDKIQEYFGVEE